MKYANMFGFHDAVLVDKTIVVSFGHQEEKFTYTFRNFFHPFVGEIVTAMNRAEDPIEALFAPSTQAMEQPFFDATYAPRHTAVVDVTTSPIKNIDVDEHGPYANYNWELFFHIPMTVATHLSKTRRFAEAQRWFHFIFDPTSNDQSLPPPKRFWNFLAFRNDADPKSIDELLTLLSAQPSALSPDDKKRQADILDGYQAMLNKPFNPHAIARTRHVAYQYNVVMKYLDNLIAWGDDLYQQYTVETINEATLLYVLANNILGPRPEKAPPLGVVQSKTFAQLKALSLDQMGNAMVELESSFPFNMAAPNGGAPGGDAVSGPLFGIGRTLYFCIPPNEKLLSYWDLVADRLFKIRHCMDITGVVRPLALFDPPIDPGMLVAAAAAGLDVSSIVSGLNQPIGPVRSTVLIQKAIELASEVKSLGAGLLSALEKGEAEGLALLRQKHEIAIQQMTQDTRFLQWKSAQDSLASLTTTRRAALERLHYYGKLLGVPDDPNAPDIDKIDFAVLDEASFEEAHGKLVTQYDQTLTLQKVPDIQRPLDNSPAQQSGAVGAGKLHLNSNEDADLNVHPPAARSNRENAMHSDTVTGLLSLIPDMGIDLHFWGLGGHMNVFGGSLLATVGRFYSSLQNTSAAQEEGQSASAAKTGGHQRRAADWVLQYNSAAHEVMQNGRQILGALIGEQVAKHDYDIAKQQAQNALEIDQFLESKFTNKELYLWMQGEISRLYYEYYRFAFDVAQKAERTVKTELMRPELSSQSFIKFNYWDAGRKGLLAGEALHLDLKRLEMAYHDNNKREFELTRHISLRQLNPIALLQLKTTGSCQFGLPEWLFDRDCPGHYMRRIKSVAVSIPSVTGPYTSVNATLSLLQSSIRTSPLLLDGEYLRQGTDDSRFVDYAGALQSIVTSSASNDSGLFDINLHDDRFLPFEGAGLVGTWQLSLPTAYPAFDRPTISDVILHYRYTSRPGVQIDKVQTALDDLFAEASGSGANLALLFSLPHDFPTEWSAFVNGDQDLSITVGRDYFPYFVTGKQLTLQKFELYGMDGKHHEFGDPAARTTDLQAHEAFTLSAPPDAAGPTQALTRTLGAEPYLVVRYTV
ncbi:MAG: hypothetical protein ACR652_06750 [Methylocystis sp.]|uniref:Tc toxin subunit A-related protein n=1 Tax=Methylocystis sp. TaxID=1911079 RepID=UPI003DA4E207